MRRALVCACILLVVALPGASGAAEGATAPGIERLATCLASQRQLNVLFLIDESGSLTETDPANRRVGAIKGALAGLELLQNATADAPVPVDVNASLAAFGPSFTVIEPWGELSDDGRWAAAADGFRERNDGIDTDYYAALEGARTHVADAPRADNGSEPCSAVFWFTDGAYDIEPRNEATLDQYGRVKDYAPDIPLDAPDAPERLRQRGLDLLCQPAGVVDQLRATGTHLMAFGLAPGIAPAERDQLEAIAIGEGGSATCGSVPVPPGSALGAYLPADDLDQLTSSLFDAVNQIGNGTQAASADVPVCEREACATGTVEFDIDPGLASFNLLALTGSQGITAELRSPESSTPLVVSPGGRGTGTVGSATVSWNWLTDDSAVMAVELPDPSAGPWFGKWSVTFIDTTGEHPDAIAKTRVYVFGDLTIELDEGTAFRRGEAGQFGGRVGAANGAALPTGALTEDELAGVVKDPTTGDAVPVSISPIGPDGRFSGEWDAPDSVTSPFVDLELTLEPVTESGLALSPVTRVFSVDVRPPAAYPTVSPSELELSDSVGVAGSTGEITITGPENGAGCVWLESASFDVKPAGMAEVAVSTGGGEGGSEGECVAADAGEVKSLTVTAVPSDSVDGATQGLLTLNLRSSEDSRVLRLELPTSFTTSRPVDEGQRLALLLLFTLIGLLVPIGFLAILNRLTGKYAPTQELWVASVPVSVGPDGLTRRDGTPPRVRREEYLRFSGSPRSVPRTSIAGLDFDRNVRLVRAPVGLASAPGKRVRSEWHRGGSDDDGRLAPVPFRLGGVVLLVLADGDIDSATTWPIDGTVVAFVETSYFDGHVGIVDDALKERGRVLGEWVSSLRAGDEPQAEPGKGHADDAPPSSFATPSSPTQTNRPPSSFQS